MNIPILITSLILTLYVTAKAGELSYSNHGSDESTFVEVKYTFKDAQGEDTGSISSTIITQGNLKPIDDKDTCISSSPSKDLLVYNARLAVASVRTVVVFVHDGRLTVISDLATSLRNSLSKAGLTNIEPDSLEYIRLRNHTLTIRALRSIGDKEKQEIFTVDVLDDGRFIITK